MVGSKSDAALVAPNTWRCLVCGLEIAESAEPDDDQEQ
jgi:hypothetical protein